MAYVIFDTETTGLSPQLGDRMVEIAAVRVMNGVVAEETFHSLINPHRLISPEASRVNGITSEMVNDAPEAAIVIPEFLQFVGTDILVAHNAEFDMGFLHHEMKLLGMDASHLPTYMCTLAMAREKLPQLGRHNLDVLMQHFGITVENRHRALDDVLATVKIFLEMHQEEPTLF